MSNRRENVHYIHVDQLLTAQNLNMLSLYNNNANKLVELRRLEVYQSQYAVVAGVIIELDFNYLTVQPTAGTSLTIRSRDSLSDTTLTAASIEAKHSATISAEDHIIKRIPFNNKEVNYGYTTFMHIPAGYKSVIFEAKPDEIGFLLKQGRGISVKNITNNALGVISLFAEFIIKDL